MTIDIGTPGTDRKPILTPEQQKRRDAFRAMLSRWDQEWQRLSPEQQAIETAAYERAMARMNSDRLELREQAVEVWGQ